MFAGCCVIGLLVDLHQSDQTFTAEEDDGVYYRTKLFKIKIFSFLEMLDIFLNL